MTEEPHTITWPRMVQLLRLQSYAEFLVAELSPVAIKRLAGKDATLHTRLTVQAEAVRDALHCLRQAEERADADIAATPAATRGAT